MRRVGALALLLGCATIRAAPPFVEGAPSLDAVVRVRGVGACLGVRVAPGVVLTAAHCVLGVRGLGDVTVTASGARRVAVTSCALHPALRARYAGCDQGGPDAGDLGDLWTDLAVLRVPDPPDAPWMPWLDAAPTEGAAAWVIADAAPTWVESPAPRAVGNRVTRVEPGALCAEGPRREDVSTQPGDSGGPLLLRRGGRWVVGGILSGGRRERSPDSHYAATYAPETAAWLARLR